MRLESPGEKWARKAHSYLARRGTFRGFRKLTEGQKYQLIRIGLEEYLRLNPLPPEFADEAIEWFLAHRKYHEAKALAKLMGRRVPRE